MGATALSQYQMGFEATPGTIVVAQRLIPAVGTFNVKQTHAMDKMQRGTYDPYINLPLISSEVNWDLKGAYLPIADQWLWPAAIGPYGTAVVTAASAPNPVYSTYTMTPGNTLQTFTWEEFDGTATWKHNYCTVTDLEFSWAANKAVEWNAKGFAQSKATLSALTALVAPTDLIMVGSTGIVGIGNTGGTIGGTPFNDLETFKLSIKLGTKPVYTAINSKFFSRTYRAWREVEVNLEVDMPNTTEYVNFTGDTFRYFQVILQGQPLAAGATKFEQLTFNLPLKYTVYDIDKGKENLQAKVKGICVYDATLGYSHELILQTFDPNYPVG